VYTNYNGRYIGDKFLDPLFEELNRRKATVFVHPTKPADEVKLEGLSAPVIEYCFDSTRAVANMLFTKGRQRFPDVKFIFSHGGGALPFLASRLALQTTFPFHGGWDYDESLEVLKSFYYDLAVGTSEPQLAALTALVGTDKLLFGSDCR
jgi:predicted TIM-barrel fold metal-dependent hydrolase